jgi:hypothetical protein
MEIQLIVEKFTHLRWRLQLSPKHCCVSTKLNADCLYSTSKMEALVSTEMLISIYQTTRRLSYCGKISTLNMVPAGISEIFACTYTFRSNIRKIFALKME